jgi:serine/threonine-protein kinase ULK2
MRTNNNQCLTPRLTQNKNAITSSSNLLIQRTTVVTGIKLIGDYQIMTEKLLGKGHYGKVYLAYHRLNQEGKPLVCKVIDRAALSAKGEKMIKNEIVNLQMINDSQNVIRLVKTFKTSTHYYIITEQCNGGDVSELLTAQPDKCLSEIVARNIITQVCQGLEDMHCAGVIHRDVKLPNILVNFECPVPLKNGSSLSEEELLALTSTEKQAFLAQVDLIRAKFAVKIADLGFSKYVDPELPNLTMCGTPLYMSPQIVRELDYSLKTDIWSMGAIYYEMLTGRTPF